MKFIIGYAKLVSGTRDELMKAAEPFIAATRAESGCRYFDLNPRQEDPDGIVIIECFDDEAAHVVHDGSAHMAVFREVLGKLVVDSHFDFVWSDQFKTNRGGRAEDAFAIRPQGS